MSEWAELQLSDICNLISSKTSMTNASLENYVSTENMVPNFGGLVKAEKLPSGTMVNAFLTEDVLFSNIRTYFKKVWSAQFEGTVSADVLVFRAKQLCYPKFLYYTLCEPDFTEYTVLTSRGAKMPRGDKEAILSYKVSLPPLPEQKAIASVLSSLDDKIDLLHRQNKTLEAMAETLFRQWFIEEAKEDWEEVQLKDLVFVIDNRGKTPPYLEEATDHPIIEVNALTKNGRAIDYSVIRKYVTKETFDTWFRQYLEPLDIVLSTVGSIGSFGMFFGGGGCVAQNIIGLRAQKKISNFFLYQWLVANTDVIKELDIGSVQPSIKVPHLLSLSVKIPMTEKLEKFDTQVEDWVRKILALYTTNFIGPLSYQAFSSLKLLVLS